MSRPNIIGALQTLLAPMGIKARAFIADYRDRTGRDFNREHFTVGNYSDQTIISALMRDYDEKGYTVSAIHELLDGFSHAELEVLAKRDLNEATKHLRLMYLDKSIGSITRQGKKIL